MRVIGKLWKAGSQWRVDCDPHVKIRLKRVFGKVGKYTEGTIIITDTLENCRDLAWFLSRYRMDINESDKEYLKSRSLQHKTDEIYVSDLLAGHIPPLAFELALPLRQYQNLGVTLAYRNRGLLIADDVGIGKTAQGIGLIANTDTLPALVVTLTHLPRQWESEILRFAPHLKTHIISKGQPYLLGGLYGTPDVLITNYHKLRGWADTLKDEIKTVIFDEVHELRRIDSDKYRSAQAIAHRAQWRLGLSATPIFNYGDEFYSVLSVLSPDRMGSREEFIREWCGGDTFGNGKRPIKEPKAFGAYVRTSGLMIRRTREQVGRELPPLTKSRQVVDADFDALDKVSNACAELAKIILGGSKVKGEKMLAAGELDNALRQATGIAKAPYVAEFVRLIAESGEKVLLSGWHRAVYDIWNEKLADLNPVMFTGSESPKEKEISRLKFLNGHDFTSESNGLICDKCGKHEAYPDHAEANAKVMIMSNRAGQGIDGLQKVCRIVVIGELDWAPAVHEQFIGRIARDGQKDSVTAYFMVAEVGADPVIEDVLGLKRMQSEPIRNPDAELIEKLVVDENYIKKLAEGYLAKSARAN